MHSPSIYHQHACPAQLGPTNLAATSCSDGDPAGPVAACSAAVAIRVEP